MYNTKQNKLVAKSLYEIRILLSNYLGKSEDVPENLQIAAKLAYALHNECLDIINDKTFDIDNSMNKIKKIDSLFGTDYCNKLEKDKY